MKKRRQITDLLIDCNCNIREALLRIDNNALGSLIVVDKQKRLMGVLTEGDIRRGILGGKSLETKVSNIMKTDCVSVKYDATPEEINRHFSYKILFIPLIDDSRVVVDYATKTRLKNYPVAEPIFNGNETSYLLECVSTGWISSQGPFIPKFEQIFAEYHGVEHALAVSSGTAALHLAMTTLGIGPGDEVLLPNVTFAACANAVIYTGATPVFVDIDSRSWNIDLDKAKKKITQRTRAIMVVHLYGNPCDMDSVQSLATEYDLRVVEDCSQALGAIHSQRPVGVLGDVACFSFFGNKIITTGEGGMLLFKQGAHRHHASILRDHGMSKEKRYWHEFIGYNYRLTNMQAAIGLAQMERIDETIDRKNKIMIHYDSKLKKFSDYFKFQNSCLYCQPVCWLYTLLINDHCPITRDKMIEKLRTNGIDARPFFHPLHLMPPYSKYASNENFPDSREISKLGISLPSSANLASDDIDRICDTLLKIIDTQILINTGN